MNSYYNAKEPDDIQLIPSENGKDCPGNGTHEDIEICCDECDYFLFCFEHGVVGYENE